MPDTTAPTSLRRADLNLPVPYVAPQTEPETRIAAAFARVFKLDQVGLDDDFYDLGGDSLMGEHLGMELSQDLGIEFPISRLFDQGSPRKIAAAMDRLQPAVTSVSRPPLFVVHGISGHTVPRPAFYEGLADDQAMTIFELPGLRGNRPVPHRVEGIAAEYVAQVQRDYPQGPLYLAAFCAGWLIAVEMAHQLNLAGRPVDHLVLLDPTTPSNLTARFKGGTGGLLPRLITLVLRGRMTGGAAAVDFEDETLLAFRVRVMDFENAVNTLRARLFGRRAERFIGTGFDAHAKAMLRADLRHYWPVRYDGSADILCSREKMRLFEGPASIVRGTVPKGDVRAIVATHKDITGASGSEVSRGLQTALDKRSRDLGL